MKKAAKKLDLGAKPKTPYENFQVGESPSKAFGLRKEERSLVLVGEDEYIERPIILCVMAVEELVRPPSTVAEEHRYDRHTTPSLVGQLMFPEKHNAQGHKVQGPKNAQGCALAAVKWLKRAEKAGYIEYYYASYAGTYSRGWKITDKGKKLATDCRLMPVGVEWLKDREDERKKQAADREQWRKNNRRRK